MSEQSAQLFPKMIDETVSKLNKEAQRIKRGGLSPQLKNVTKDNLFPMRVNVDKENSAVEIIAIVGRGLYLHNLKRLLTSTLKVVEHHDWQVIHASEDVSFPTSDDPVICMNYETNTIMTSMVVGAEKNVILSCRFPRIQSFLHKWENEAHIMA